MTRIHFTELPDGVIRRLEVTETEDVDLYINTKYMPGIGGKKDEHQGDL